MKLHLPKLLLAAVVASTGHLAQADVQTVDFHTGANNLPSKEANRVVYEKLEVSTGDKFGAFDANGNELTLGLVHYDKNILQQWSDKSTGNATKNVEVTGTLTINDDAQVRLGGQYKLSTVSGLGASDEYTGIIADKVVVNGKMREDGTPFTTNLSTWNATVNTLEVNSGKVEIRQQVQSGNNFFNFGAPADSKQAQFKREVNIHGGVTLINLNSLDSSEKPYNELDDKHIFSTFGEIVFKKGGKEGSVTDYTKADYAEIHKCQIHQTAGTIVVQGKTASVGGLNIKQEGGSMSISTNGSNLHSWHILSDYGDSKIEQSGAKGTVLNIGGIGAFNSKYSAVVDKLKEYGVAYDETTGEFTHESESVNVRPVLELSQTGEGTINIFKGIDFSDHRQDSIEDSSIKQSGGGVINLGGVYNGVVFDITQEGNGGTLNVNGNLSTDVVTQNGAGEIKVAEGVSLSANTLNVTSGVARSATSAVTGSNVTLSGGSLSTEGSTVTNTGSLAASELTINSGTFVNKGTLSAADAQAIAALASEEDAGLAVLGASAGFTITVGPNGTFENSGKAWCDILVDGGTLTLGAGSENYEITMNSGTIDVQGDITSGSLTLNGGTINFADGATVTLADDATLNISEDTTIMVTVTPEMLENLEGMEFELFAGNASNLTSANIVFTDGDDDHSNDMSAVVTTGSSSGSIKVESSEVVPEPTTATLSLLALCGLVMRRRRK